VPIVTLTALPADGATVDRVLARLVTDLAAAVDCPVGDVWVSFVPAAAQHLGLRRATAGSQCPIVVVRGRARSGEKVAAALAAAAAAVGAELDVPVEDVWLQWIDVVVGRAFVGGGPI
jgi:hypothetical protein